VPDFNQIHFEWFFLYGFTSGFENWTTDDSGVALFCYLRPEFYHRVLVGL